MRGTTFQQPDTEFDRQPVDEGSGCVRGGRAAWVERRAGGRAGAARRTRPSGPLCPLSGGFSERFWITLVMTCRSTRSHRCSKRLMNIVLSGNACRCVHPALGSMAQPGHDAKRHPWREYSRHRKNRNQKTIITRKEHDHECIENRDQRPHLRHDRGRSNRSPGRTRWQDVLLLRRALSEKVSVHARRR